MGKVVLERVFFRGIRLPLQENIPLAFRTFIQLPSTLRSFSKWQNRYITRFFSASASLFGKTLFSLRMVGIFNF
jgi:hypothetical protein